MPFTGFYQSIPQIDWSKLPDPAKETSNSIQSLLEMQQKQKQLQMMAEEQKMKQQEMSMQAADREEQRKANIEKAKAVQEKARLEQVESELENKALQSTLEFAKSGNTTPGQQTAHGISILSGGGSTKALKEALREVKNKIENAPSFEVANDYSTNVLNVPLDKSTWVPKGGIKTATTMGRIYDVNRNMELMPELTATARSEEAKQKQAERDAMVAGQLKVKTTPPGRSLSDVVPKPKDNRKELQRLMLKYSELKTRLQTLPTDMKLDEEQKPAIEAGLLEQLAIVRQGIAELGGTAPETPSKKPVIDSGNPFINPETGKFFRLSQIFKPPATKPTPASGPVSQPTPTLAPSGPSYQEQLMNFIGMGGRPPSAPVPAQPQPIKSVSPLASFQRPGWLDKDQPRKVAAMISSLEELGLKKPWDIDIMAFLESLSPDVQEKWLKLYNKKIGAK